MLGSALQCLRDEVYVPQLNAPYKCVRFEGVEAYRGVERRALDKPLCAAGPRRPCIGSLSYHSIMEDTDCVFEFDALRLAAQLHLECLQDEAAEAISTLAHPTGGRGPLSDEIALNSQPADDRGYDLEDNGDYDEYHISFNDNAGHLHPLPATIPLHLRPYWIQELATDFAQWSQAIGAVDQELKVRSWFLQPDRFPIWRSPRPIHFNGNTDFWENDLRAVWHDVFEHELAVDINIVHPVPERAPCDMGYFADIILGQNLGEWNTALMVTQFAGNPRAQIRTQAHLVPDSLHKWEAIDLAEASRLCGSPAYPLDHYRVCQLYHGHHQIGALPVYLHLGDCLHILIYPPILIDETSDSDEVTFLTTSPTSTSGAAEVTRLSSGYALSSRTPTTMIESDDAISLLAARDQGHLQPPPPIIDNEDIALTPERIFDGEDEEVPEEPYDEPDSLHDEQEQQEILDNAPRYAAIVYLIHSPPVRLRLAFGNRNRFYATIANAIQIPDQSIVFLHSIATPPDDLVQGHTTPMIAQLTGEITPGSIHRYVLIDIEFHANLPTLTPEVDRSTKLIPKQLTRDQVLRILGLHSYCFRAQQGRQRCLMWQNGQIIPDHRIHHLSFNHGDYIRIALPPDHTAAESFSTRELAAICYNGDALYADLGDAGRELMADILPNIPPDTPIVYALPAIFNEEPDDSNLMQRPGESDYKRTAAGSTQPLERFRLPEFERLLSADFTTLATCALQHPSQRVPVHAWYLDHERHPRQRADRLVFLGPDPQQWRQMLLAAWWDYARPDIEAIFHIVQPHPSSELGGNEIHILITQNPVPGLASILISTSFPPSARGFQERIAVAFGRITSREDVFNEIDCENSDLLRHFVCEQVHLGTTVAAPSLIYPLRDGLHIIVEIGFKPAATIAGNGDPHIEVSATLPFTIAPDDADPATFLQTALTVRDELTVTRTEPLLCKTNEDLQVLREQIQGLVDQAERNQDRRLLEDLAALEPVLRDLHGLWLRVATPWQRNALWAPVSVWFISHLHWRICTSARAAWLSEDVRSWRDTILHVWADQIVWDDNVELFLATPSPVPAIGDGAAHIIIVQHQTHFAEHAALVSLIDNGYQGGHPQRQAMVLPRRISHESLLTVSNRLDFCERHRQVVHCSSWCGSLELTHRPFLGRAGLSYTIQVLRTVAGVANTPITYELAPLPNLFPVALHPAAPRVASDLHEAIWARRSQHSDSPINLRITTWFVNHRTSPQCLYGRDVDLPLNPNLWALSILSAWQDIYDPGLPFEGFLVHPMPSTSQWIEGNTWHVILHQEPHADLCSILVTSFDVGRFGAQAPGIQRAFVVPKSLQREDVLWALQLDQWCDEPGQHRDCRVFRQGAELTQGLRFTCSHGWGFLALFSDHLIPRLPQVPIDDEEALNLLQLGVQQHRTTISIANLLERDNISCNIDCAAATRAWDALDQHFFLPQLDVVIDDKHPASSWLSLWWDFYTPGSDLVLYYDGSFTRGNDEDQAGFAVAAFLLTAHGWAFCGILSGALSDVHDGYMPELAASSVASKWAFDICKLHKARGFPAPAVIFRFDSLTVGQQSKGLWGSKTCSTMTRTIRALHGVCQHAFGVRLDSQHINSHCGEPGNELVDYFAKEAALGTSHGTLDLWLTHLTTDLLDGLERAWMLFDASFVQYWTMGKIVLPAPISQPDPDSVLPFSAQHSSGNFGHGHLELRLCTFNVTTLCARRALDASAPSGPARQAALLKQMYDKGVHIFAFQETRLRKQHFTHDEHFLLYRSSATDTGQGGLLIGLAKTRAIGTTQCNSQRSSKIYFKDSDVHYLIQTSRALVLRLRNAALKAIVIAVHAPHSGQSLKDIQDWWTQLVHSLPRQYADWPRILLADANAEVGALPNEFIGTHQAGSHNLKSEPFVDFVVEQGVFLPSTFASHHQGERSTWLHPNGSASRIDYIGLPSSWAMTSCSTFVDGEVDACLARPDHLPLFCDAKLTVVLRFELQHEKGKQLRWDDLPVTFIDPYSLPQPDFAIDVHTHAAVLQQALHDCLSSQVVPRVAKPRRASMTSNTWNLVQAKKSAKRHLMDLDRLHRSSLLQVCFTAWKGAREPQHRQFDQILAQQDKLIAIALAEFRWLGAQVQSALRDDDVAFYGAFLSDASEFLQPAQAKSLWQVVRRNLPKFRQRRLQPAPFQLAQLEDDWVPHFCQLEAGSPIESSQLVQQCHLRQQRAAASHSIDCLELPTLNEVEDAIRATQPGRSTGFDTIPSGIGRRHPVEVAQIYYKLLLKMFLWKMEPAQWKGGPMAIIPKKPVLTAVEHGRGIMLLPSMAKVYHALLRKRLMAFLTPRRPEGQLGGFKHQQVTFASLALRSFCKILDAKQVTTSVIFVDLTNAFHRLIRELATGNGDQSDLDCLLEALDQQKVHFDKEAVRDNLLGALGRLGCPRHLIQVLQDVHVDTWCCLNNSKIIRTRRGTRPGSPLADAVFHVLMAEIVRDLDAWTLQQADYVALLREYGLAPISLTWADDLAIPWATSCAADMPDALKSLMSQINFTFEQRGFSVNFDHGKTGAVVTFRGQAAPRLRQEFQQCPRPGLPIQLDDERVVHLHFETNYKHLGTVFTAQHDLQVELSHRIGVAHSTFGLLSRPLLCNKRIPTDLRLRLFHALVGSKLFFGLGSWHTLPIRQLERLRKTHVGFLRRVLRIPFTAQITNSQVLHKAHTGDVRIRLAVDRLCFAQKLFAHAPELVQHVLQIEAAQHPNSWIAGLKADVDWLHVTLPSALPQPWDGDFTTLIDYWQSSPTKWKRCVTKAFKIHCQQERIMVDVHSYHQQFFRLLRQAGGTFQPDPEDFVTKGDSFTCHCKRTFSSAQGLSLHKRKAHGEFSAEHSFVHGATCSVCLQHFWSSSRLQQHLAYIPRRLGYNPCFAELLRRGDEPGYLAEQRPKEFAGLNRLEACVTQGPTHLPPGAVPLREAELRRQIEAGTAELWDFEWPLDAEALATKLGDAFVLASKLWLRDFSAHGHCRDFEPTLSDRWLGVLIELDPELHQWAEFVFLTWGNHELPELISSLEDGEAEFVFEEEFEKLTADFPRTEILDRLRALRRALHNLDPQAHLRPHRPVKVGTANETERARTCQGISRALDDQVQWHSQLKQVQWDFLPQDALVPRLPGALTRPTFLIAHLFSGRRRRGDIHEALHRWGSHFGINLQVLSLDTAVDADLGNLHHHSTSWAHLLDCYRSGRVAASIVGSPCETFSEARHMEPPDSALSRAWPRPLRSAERLFGLNSLTLREYKQLHIGTLFFLQGILALVHHLCQGGMMISEHPAPPQDPSRASIWTTGIMKLLRLHPDIHLHVFPQFLWEATVVKPTGLLALRLPQFRSTMFSKANLNCTKPHAVAIGKDADGSFRTSSHKEYPSRFCDALSFSLVSQLKTLSREGKYRTAADCSPDVFAWCQQLAQTSSRIREGAVWLPDFQG